MVRLMIVVMMRRIMDCVVLKLRVEFVKEFLRIW